MNFPLWYKAIICTGLELPMHPYLNHLLFVISYSYCWGALLGESSTNLYISCSYHFQSVYWYHLLQYSIQLCLIKATISWLQLASCFISSHFLNISLQQVVTSFGWSTFITSKTPAAGSSNNCIPSSYHRMATPLMLGFKISWSCVSVGKWWPILYNILTTI